MNESPLTWISDARTDTGCVREHNEDAVLDRPDIGLWAVADGMGGHSRGDVASNMICERLQSVSATASLAHLVEAVDEVLLGVNADLCRAGEQSNNTTIGSTVVTLLTRGRHGACLWAGDSRAYLFRAGKLTQLTQDHALVAELLDRGIISEDQAADHPHGNLVTRAIGAGEPLTLDVEIFEIDAGDVFILCSDGLDKEVSDAEIADVLEQPSHEAASARLVDLALERGSRDNVSVVEVRIVEGLPPVLTRATAGLPTADLPTTDLPTAEVDDTVPVIPSHEQPS